MTTTIDQLQTLLAEYDATADAVGMELRLSFAQIILRRLWQKGWTQKQLAESTGLKESFLSRVLHSDQNCTFETAGKILHALGVRAKWDVEGRVETDVRPQIRRFPARIDQFPHRITESVITGTLRIEESVDFGEMVDVKTFKTENVSVR